MHIKNFLWGYSGTDLDSTDEPSPEKTTEVLKSMKRGSRSLILGLIQTNQTF